MRIHFFIRQRFISLLLVTFTWTPFCLLLICLRGYSKKYWPYFDLFMVKNLCLMVLAKVTIIPYFCVRSETANYFVLSLVVDLVSNYIFLNACDYLPNLLVCLQSTQLLLCKDFLCPNEVLERQLQSGLRSFILCLGRHIVDLRSLVLNNSVLAYFP